MSPLAPDDLLLKAGLLTPGSKVASTIASAAPSIQQPAQDTGGWVPLPPDLMQKAQAGRFMVGGPAARMAMFPDEFPEAKKDKPNLVMRGIQGIAAGIADMAPATVALAGGVIDFLGADEAGAKLGQASLDMTSWLNDHLAVENPNLYDHVMRGVGSMATFILPGLGAASAAGKVATAAGLAGKAATAFRALTGGTAMSFLESAVEQSQREMELIGQGKTPEEALKESAPVFWYNMGVLMATNTVAYFLPLPIKTKNEFISRAAKAVEAAFTEGGQERAQAVIQDVVAGRGEWADFLDPKKNLTDTLVGAIVGSGSAALLPGEAEAPQKAPGSPQQNAPAQTPQTPAQAPQSQQAPAQAAQPTPPAPPPAAPAAPAPVAQRQAPPPPPPTDLPMAPAEGFDVYTEEEAPAAPEAAPAEPAAPPEPVSPISPAAPEPIRKVASEAKRRAAERKAKEQALLDEVNAEAQRRMEAAQNVKNTTPDTEAKQEAPAPAAAVELSPAAQATEARYPGDRWTVHQVPISEITERPEDMQNRDKGAASQKTIDSIKNNYDEAQMQPISLWLDPESGDLVTIQGHSRTEGFRQSGKAKIPSFIFKNMTFAEAQKAALEGNFMQDQGTDLDRVGALRGRIKSEGITGVANINELARKMFDRNGPTIVSLMSLNPDGSVMDALRSLSGAADEGDTGSNIKKMAKWIGEARRRNPNLTNAHEQEMFDALRQEFQKKPWAKTQEDFLKHVRGLATAEGFDATSRLNLGLDKRTPAEKKFDEELAAATEAVAAAKAKLKEKSEQLAAAGVDPDTKDKLLKPFRDEVSIAEADKAVVDGSRERYLEAERNQGGLFRLGKPDVNSLNKAAAARGLSPAVTVQPRDLMDEIVARVAKMFGFKNVQFVTGLRRQDGKIAHGYYQQSSDTVFLNADSTEPMLTVLMHEVGHRMEVEHSDLYGQLIQILNDPANVRTGGKEVYGKDAKARGYSEVGIEREWVSDGLMEASSRPEFWTVLQEKNPTLAGKLVNMIVDAMKAIRKMFTASGASVDVYYNNFGPLVRQIANVAAQMQAREAAGVTREATNQIEMFRIAPLGNQTAQEMRDKQDMALKSSEQHPHSGWKAGWRHVYYLMVDKHTFLYQAVRDIVKMADPKLAKNFSLTKNPYIALRRFGSWMSAVEVALKHGVYSWDGKTVLAPGLEQIIKKHGLAADIDSREFGLFYTAATLVSRKYALQRNGKDFFGTDPTSQEYQDAEAEFLKWQKIYDDYGGAESKWIPAVDDFTSYAYALIRRSYEAGIINEQEFTNLTKTYSVYAPLFVIDSSEYNVDRGDPVGAGTAAHEMTRFDPTAVRMDPIDALIKQTYHMEFFTRRNDAARQHADFIRAFRDKTKKGVTVLEGFGMRVRPKEDPVAKRVGELLKAAGMTDQEIAALGRTPQQLETEAKLYVTSRLQPDGVIGLMRDGNVEYWQLDPDIYESFMAATGPKASHPLMKLFSAQTSLLRAGAVLTPDFMARNQFRDFASAAIISQHLIRNPADPFLVPVRILRGLAHAIKKDDVYLEFMLEAGHAQLTAQDQNGLRKSSEMLTRGARGRSGRLGQAAKNPAKYVLHSHPVTILQEIGKLTENSSRIAVYEKTKADLLKMGKSEAEARVKAAMEARESSIDFSRSGKYGQVINQIIPFFNAAVQGNDKAFRTFVVDSGGRGAAWLKAAALVTVPSVLLWALNHDDDWYKDQPIWLKNNFWLFSVDGGKTIHKLPKPFEVGLMYASLAERFLDWRADKDPKAMDEWARAMINNTLSINDKNPVASVGGLLGPMAGTMTEIVSNYDSFRGTPIVKGWLEEVVPREQYTASTSEFAKALGGMAPGRGLSPIMIDHFIRGAFGGLGTYAAQAASEIVMLAKPELKAMRPSDKQVRTLVGAEVPDWIPVIRAFATASPSGYTRQMNDFFEIYDRGREASKTLQAFKASGAPREKFFSLYRRSGADLATFKAAQEVAEKLGQVSKRARFIESMPAEQMSRDEKRKQIDQLTEMRNLMVKTFLDRYYQVDQRELQRQIEASIPQIERAYGR